MKYIMPFQHRHHSIIFFALVTVVLILIGIRLSSSIEETHAATTFDARSSGASSWSHTTGSNPNRILLVGVNGNASAVRYNGVGLTKIATSTKTSKFSNTAQMSMWYMLNPPSGTYTVSVTGGSNGGSLSFYNVDQTNPFISTVTGGGGPCPDFATSCNAKDNNIGWSPTINGTTTNQLVVEASSVAISKQPSSGFSQTVQWNRSGGTYSTGATKTGGSGSTKFSWSSGNGYNGQITWASVLVALNPPAATPTPTPTLTPTLTPTPTVTPTPTLTPTPTVTPTPTGPITYTIQGNVYNDNNKNGIKDAGESNYSGTPSVTASRGTVTANSDGTYIISNLDPGPVTISINPPTGYSMTYPLNGPPPSFQVTVGPGCDTNEINGAICK